jgi:hypothetical protein
MPKEISAPIMEGRRHRGRPRKDGRTKLKGIKIYNGSKYRQSVVKHRLEWREVLLEGKFQNGM